MAYIGQAPFQEFTTIPTKDSFTGDGSTTTFDLANDVVRGAENALEVFVNNVRQEPGSGKAFTVANKLGLSRCLPEQSFARAVQKQPATVPVVESTSWGGCHPKASPQAIR